jgi:GNAT superfamily N-acetyltransferase
MCAAKVSSLLEVCLMPVFSETAANLPTIVSDAAMLREIGRLRIKSWKADGELPSCATDPEIWLDAHDDHASNWAIIRQNKPIAAARLCVHERVENLPDQEIIADFTQLFGPPVGSFNRLVVDPGFRGIGLSRLLDEVRMNAALAQLCKSVVVTSHLQNRINSFQQMGFCNLGKSKHSTVSYAPTFVFLKMLKPINCDLRDKSGI